MSIAMGILGLLVAIGFLVYMAFKGHSIIVVAPIAAILAILFSYGLKGHFMAYKFCTVWHPSVLEVLTICHIMEQQSQCWHCVE